MQTPLKLENFSLKVLLSNLRRVSPNMSAHIFVLPKTTKIAQNRRFDILPKACIFIQFVWLVLEIRRCRACMLLFCRYVHVQGVLSSCLLALPLVHLKILGQYRTFTCFNNVIHISKMGLWSYKRERNYNWTAKTKRTNDPYRGGGGEFTPSLRTGLYLYRAYCTNWRNIHLLDFFSP